MTMTEVSATGNIDGGICTSSYRAAGTPVLPSRPQILVRRLRIPRVPAAELIKTADVAYTDARDPWSKSLLD